MNISVDPAVLTAFLLAMMRSIGFVFSAQPFSLGVVPRTVRVGFAVAIALPAAHQVSVTTTVPTDTLGLVVALATQLVVGYLIGYIVSIFISLGGAAGSAVGLFGGFSPQPALDPLSLNQDPPTGQFYNFLWISLFFVSGADTLVIGGLLSTFNNAVLVHPQIGLLVVVKSVSILMGASIQIASPILSVMFLTQVIVGVLSKVSPQLNAFLFAMPLQILLSLALMGLSFLMMPSFLDGAVHYMVQAEKDLLGA